MASLLGNPLAPELGKMSAGKKATWAHRQPENATSPGSHPHPTSN